MTRVFLSFASEDSPVARRLAEFFEELGVEVFRYDDTRQPVGRVVGEMEERLAAADLFIALMSPRYLASGWCRQERDLALRQETDSGTPSVFVVKVAETFRSRAGMLGNYQWLDATGQLTRPRLSEISARLPFDATAVEAAADIRAAAEIPDFRNRHDELANLRTAHQTPGGRELWVVVAPPLMGKSWLLARLEHALTTAEERWTVRHLDLRGASLELRSNPTRLVGSLLDVTTPSPLEPVLDDAALRDIAKQVSARAARQLFVLDSAELLGPACAGAARSALTAVRRIVRASGGVRMSLVIGTRRHDEWRGMGVDARVGERFEPLRLSEFGHEVVHQALLDVPREFTDTECWEHAATLHRLSEGLPALLVNSVQWAEDTDFGQLHRADGSDVFEAVARGYVENDLLSADSLLPLGGPRQGEALTVLRGMLRLLSTYRLFTQSHLKFHIDAAPSLQEALGEAHWTQVELWEALGRSALETQQSAQEIWHEIEPPLRRVLYRYHYRTDDERIAAHALAREFYGGWTRDHAAGREQQVVLVESLWHEASRLVIEQPTALQRLLPGVAVELATTFGNSPMYEPAEFSDSVVRRLNDDDELRMLLARHEGLFEEIVKSVTLTIGGGR
jgi:hypothetical protein